MKKENVVDSPKTKGRRLYLEYLDDKKLTPLNSIIANCFECCNGYLDGRMDCELADCPLYRYMPYRIKK